MWWERSFIRITLIRLSYQETDLIYIICVMYSILCVYPSSNSGSHPTFMVFLPAFVCFHKHVYPGSHSAPDYLFRAPKKYGNRKGRGIFPSIHVHSQLYIDMNNMSRISKVIVIVVNKLALYIYIYIVYYTHGVLNTIQHSSGAGRTPASKITLC